MKQCFVTDVYSYIVYTCVYIAVIYCIKYKLTSKEVAAVLPPLWVLTHTYFLTVIIEANISPVKNAKTCYKCIHVFILRVNTIEQNMFF